MASGGDARALLLASLCIAAATPVARPAAPPAAATPRTLLAERNLSGALGRVQQQAESGDRDAAYLLGMMLHNGVGIAADPAGARLWLERAAGLDHPAAAFMLSWLASRDPAAPAGSAAMWLERAVKLGDTRALDAQRDPDALLHPVWPAGDDTAALTALTLHAARHDDVPLLQRLGDNAVHATDEFNRSALSLAVEADALRALDWLLEHGADPRSADRHGVTPLMHAAGLADSVALTRLLQHAVDVNAADAERRSALMLAARYDRQANLELLRAAGANPAAQDSRGYNALDIALLANASHAAATLRDWGLKATVAHGPAGRPGLFDATHPGELYRNWPPLALATARDDVNSLRQLLDSGLSPDQRTPQGDTLLHVAYHAGAADALALLLARGADATAGDRRGRSVLGLAATDASRGDVLATLLKARVSADAHAGGEPAPLLAAVRAGLNSSVSQLLAAGAHIDVRDGAGDTSLTVAVLKDEAAPLSLLLQHGANVNARNARGRSALWVAASLGHTDQVRALLAAGAAADIADQDEVTPLAVAAGAGKLEVVEAMLRARASARHADHGGDTPLHAAAAAGHAPIVQALLRASAAPDVINQRGDTALIAASRGGHVEACRLLLAAGAPRTLRNKDRQTAADVARNRGFTSLAGLIDQKT